MKRAATQICLSNLPRLLAVATACLLILGGCSEPQTEPEEQVRQLLSTVQDAIEAKCSEPQTEPEEQVRQLLSTVQDAIEAKQRRELLSMVSPAYSDAHGNDRNDIGNLFRVYFLRQNSIKIISSIDEIRLFGDTAAEVDLTAGLAGSNDRALGFSASAYRFEFELVKEGDDWSLVSARWGRLGDELK
jgi:hypothetical protein